MNKTGFSQDIIIVGQQPWDTEIGSNCKNIAIELSKNNRVLYINSPLDRITLIRNKTDDKIIKRLKVIKGKEKGLAKIMDNLWNYYPDCIVESINWINSHKIFDFLNKINNKRFAKSVFKAIEELQFNNFILFNDNEMFKGFYLKEYLNPRLSVYYSRDYMIGVDYWKKHGERLEPLLIGKSDLCFTNSTYLSDYCKTYNLKSYYVGQGCDVEDFDNADTGEKPSDLMDIKTKIIGYVGSLNSERLDIEVIEHIATSFPQYKVVLVGPEDGFFKTSNLHNSNNIIFLGQKPTSELPTYISFFDVCINPQLVNKITIGNYPRKIDEYLLLGKPTVVTGTKTMEVFKDFVYIANNKQDYIKLIEQAINEQAPSLARLRIDFALTHTWENSVKEMMNYVSVHLDPIV